MKKRKTKKIIRLIISTIGEASGLILLLLFVYYEKIKENKYLIIAAIVAVVALIMLITYLSKVIRRRKYLNSPLSVIDAMSGEEFEEYLKYYFENQGYKVKLTPVTNDYGADLVLKRDSEVTVVQAKRWNEPVGNSAIQEVVASKGYYKATKAMVVTNSTFTTNAINLAKANDVILWDRNYIKNNFDKITAETK